MARASWLIGGALLLVYAACLPPSASWGDSGELAAVCRTLGIAHPTGYPLYTLLGWLWIHLLPWGEPAWRMNLFSALCAAAAGGILTTVFHRWTAEFSNNDAFAALAGAALAALAVGLAPLYWSQAVICEVYAPLALAVAWMLLAWQRALAHGRWFGCALAAGCAVMHHRLALALLPGLLLSARARGGARFDARQARAVALGLALGLLPALYLPLRALAKPPLNWGDPSTLTRWAEHLLGAQYAGNLRLELVLRDAGARLWEAPEQYGAALVIALWGGVLVAARAPRQGAALALLIALPYLVGMSYAVGDWFVFLLPAHIVLGLPLAVGAGRLLAQARAPGRPRVAGLAALLLLIGIGPLWNFSRGWPYQRLARQAVSTPMARAWLDAAPPDAAILTGLWYPHADNEFGALLYARYGLGLRPDVAVIGSNFLLFPWYAEQLEPLGVRWVADGKIMDAAGYFARLETDVIEPLMRRRPVCVTQSFQELHGRPWIGGPIQVPPSLRARYAAELIAAATPSLAAVDARLAYSIPRGRLYQLREAAP